MKRPLRVMVLVACALGLAACWATEAELRIDVPAVLPPLVTVEPGVQVVEDYGQEIFFVDGYYWVRRGDAWYRASDPHARWVLVERPAVPAVIVRSPPGRYAHWRRDQHSREEGRRDGREESRREERHEERGRD